MSLRLEDVRGRRGTGFTLEVPHWEAHGGQLQAVMGTNGAGKSSFFAALSGELAVTGTLLLHGRPLSSWCGAERARHLGVLTQHAALDFAFTAAEVVALGLTPLSAGWRVGQRRVREVMHRCDCAQLAERAYPSLSGGERQRVQLARVLLQLSEAEQCPVLLLDEPTAAQDIGHQHHVLALARSLARDEGWTVVAILHDLNQALRYADSCALLQSGRLSARGAPGDILDPVRVADVWGYQTRRIDLGGGRSALL